MDLLATSHVLDAILESGERKKVLVLSKDIFSAHGIRDPQRARLKHFDARISSFTERNENIPTWPQGSTKKEVFDLK